MFHDFSAATKDAFETFTADMITSALGSNFLALVTSAVVTVAIITFSTLSVFPTVYLKKNE